MSIEAILLILLKLTLLNKLYLLEIKNKALKDWNKKPLSQKPKLKNLEKEN